MLFTDHYQLTMAQLYFREGLHERRARFDHTFRSYPDYGKHQSGYCIAAGLEPLLGWVEDARFDDVALDTLRRFSSTTGTRLFADDFLAWLAAVGGFESLDIWAVPEGRVVHAGAPLTTVEGPLALAQILESPLLNVVNFETLIATKASRVVEAAHGGVVLEFGMRRAHGRAAGGATRASLIGGCHASSNVVTSAALGIPSEGTHAHSMVQVFMAVAGDELAAFQAYADVYPDDCLLLVDTVNTLESGVPNAIRVFEKLRSGGHVPLGIRLDSGDLAHLAVRSADLLNAAGFDQVRIVLSSALDELTIWQIRNQIAEEAPRYGLDADHLLARLVYGVGSRMVTSDGSPSLDGVYKVAAVHDEAGRWVPAIKLSDSPEKVANPGRKKAWRVYDERGTATADLVGLHDEDASERPLHLHHPTVPGVMRSLPADRVSEVEPLLVPALVGGTRIAVPEDLDTLRKRRLNDLERLDPGVRRIVNPHRYHVSLTDKLNTLKGELIASLND